MNRGLVIGKFMPLHKGHELLINSALDVCHQVVVFITAKADDKIKLISRKNALMETYSDYILSDRLFILSMYEDDVPETEYDENGTALSDEFWKYWKEKFITLGVDCVFTSDLYGQRLAEELDAVWYPIDPKREVFPISGSAIRSNIPGNWLFINEHMRQRLSKKICVVGPESTGKSTLVEFLAQEFGGIEVPEYGRTLSEFRENELTSKDFDVIATIHERMVFDASMSSSLVFVDTDRYTTKLFSDIFEVEFNFVCDYIDYDFYILLAPTVPLVDDGTRVTNQEQREKMFDEMRDYLVANEKKFVIINNNEFGKRLRLAVRYVETFLNEDD